MIRTKAVKLTAIPAIAFRQKLTAGGSGITILRSDTKQPGIASISTVRDMVAEKKSAAAIRNYIISHKIKNITGNEKLTSKELKKMVELLDEVSPKGVYKELNSEIRKMIGSDKKK